MACNKCNNEIDIDDLTCSFQNSDTFGDNWGCGLISDIRDLCEDAMNGKISRANYQYCEDQKYVSFNITEVELNNEFIGYCLWICWYKSRNRTDAMWILEAYDPPRKPTFNELKSIINYFKK